MLGISVDSVPSHEEFGKKCGVTSYTLLSDMRLEAAKAYGVVHEDEFARRTDRVTVVVDQGGTVRFIDYMPLGQKREPEDILAHLREIEGK